MCLSSKPAEMAKTKLYAGETTYQGKLVHVIGYSNQVQNRGSGPNCMMLAFQSAAPMSPENVVETNVKSILDDMAAAIPRLRSRSMSFLAKGVGDAVHVFRTGIYQVVLGNVNGNIAAGLSQVSDDSRPEISAEIFDFWRTKYAGYHVALCCFNNAQAKEADPLLWWYEPKDQNVLVAPAIDGHDGKPPKDGPVDVDHMLMASSHLMQGGHPVRYQDRDRFTEPMLRLLPNQVIGMQINARISNGDFIIPIDMVRGGDWDQGQVRRGIHAIAV